MLIFFIYKFELVAKEWKSVKTNTYLVLIIGLLILVLSFCITSYGSYMGEQLINGSH
jgi:L-rhamnose-H+ transport protein